MRIAKPLLLVSTPIGVVTGLYEAHRFGNWLMFLMLGLIAFLSVAAGTVVYTIRRERAEERAKEAQTKQEMR